MFKKWKNQRSINEIVFKRLNNQCEMAHDRIDNQHKRIEGLERQLHELEQFTWASVGVAGAAQPEREEFVAETLEARIANAIANGRSLVFNYTKPEGGVAEVRTLSPYELIKVRGGVVVRGWDHVRGDIRSFRLDRIESLNEGVYQYRLPFSS